MPEASLRRSHSTLIALSSFINVRAAGLVGNRVGQLGFSWFTDILSHQNGVGFMIDIIGSSGQAPTMSVVSASEFAAPRSRGRHMTAVLAFQGGGQSAYRNEIVEAPYSVLKSVDCCWGHIIGSGGCISGFVALYLSLTIPDTHSFVMEIERYVAVAAKDV
ncbi:hypothetical protein EDD17DRAFT_1788188 [Pisolithus thermaeus]|nr:hypothetical protein EDD17DRAFT_1788188 [Pisolithus thermaeus]